MSDYFAPLMPGDDGFYRTGSDERMFVRFSRRARRHGFKSEQAGRPIYEPVDYITIQQPGERDQTVRPVIESDKHRWPKLWQAYLDQVEQVSEGTPIAILFPNEPQIVELLLDLKIDTIEQLAAASEHAIERLGMDGRKYVERAQATLSKAAQASEVNKLARQLEDAKDELATLRQANEDLKDRLDALERQRRAPRRIDPEDLAQPEERGRSPDPSGEPPPATFAQIRERIMTVG